MMLLVLLVVLIVLLLFVVLFMLLMTVMMSLLCFLSSWGLLGRSYSFYRFAWSRCDASFNGLGSAIGNWSILILMVSYIENGVKL